jgi:hypothetical protein
VVVDESVEDLRRLIQPLVQRRPDAADPFPNLGGEISVHVIVVQP